ncbi:MAG: hypothetical protein A2X72_20630 [Burkholderiales bacterium GWF1_66_17]|nr:MAG: hypothetical protein A2X73_03055 [Burkholderiales bacterium GWE1_65_30]OGA93484.1 MAG: hypothetical protein A2X72_20630 [Burkholderiales bacterium GWF1_66_17]
MCGVLRHQLLNRFFINIDNVPLCKFDKSWLETSPESLDVSMLGNQTVDHHLYDIEFVSRTRIGQDSREQIPLFF